MLTKTISAPGKLMISGEYVVLDGVECLVTAVDRRLTARWSAAETDHSTSSQAHSPQQNGHRPEVLLAQQYAESRFGQVSMQLQINPDALSKRGRKIGLGSSAAGAAAAVGAVMAFHGFDPAKHRAEIFDIAMRGHHAVAPQGSGADVAAAALGGTLRYDRNRPLETSEVQWPEKLQTRIVWTGKPARTNELVKPVRQLSTHDPKRYAEISAPLRCAANAFRDAFVAADIAEIIRQASIHGEAMGSLGDAVGAPILTPELAQVDAIAKRYGGGAKPSGAGGGDAAMAFFPDQERAEQFTATCLEASLTLLPMRMGADGVRIDPNQASTH